MANPDPINEGDHRCPTCGSRPVEYIRVEYASGEYVDTYWTNDTYDGKTAMQAALDRIKYLKDRWDITAVIRTEEKR